MKNKVVITVQMQEDLGQSLVEIWESHRRFQQEIETFLRAYGYSRQQLIETFRKHKIAPPEERTLWYILEGSRTNCAFSPSMWTKRSTRSPQLGSSQAPRPKIIS